MLEDILTPILALPEVDLETLLLLIELELRRRRGCEVVEVRRGAGFTYQLEMVKCGKRNCHCAAGALHGPYWYRYYRRGGRLVSEYVGKKLPTDNEPEGDETGAFADERAGDTGF